MKTRLILWSEYEVMISTDLFLLKMNFYVLLAVVLGEGTRVPMSVRPSSREKDKRRLERQRLPVLVLFCICNPISGEQVFVYVVSESDTTYGWVSSCLLIRKPKGLFHHFAVSGLAVSSSKSKIPHMWSNPNLKRIKNS